VTPSGSREREVALDAVRWAARLTRSVRATFTPDLAASKPDRSPVTVADLGAQVLVSLALSAAFPTDPLVGEEDSSQLSSAPIREALQARLWEIRPGLDSQAVSEALDRGGSAGGRTGRWWTLDPVDGTLGFLRGGQYAIALALVEDGVVRLGVLGCPALERADGSVGGLFVAERGGGAWELPLDEDVDPVRLRVASCTTASEARYAESFEAAHSAQDEAARIGERLGISAPPLRLDSQAKYALVARGDASVYLRIPRGGYVENIWDHAAGSILVEEAGGLVSDIEGATLDWGRGRRLEGNRGIIAAPAAIHAEVVAAAREVMGARVA
jgi:HAL2 family 3'(2'),5'-bisphosphate nucleotidase